MKTIEELEAELETVTRERDRSLFAWESAGMTGRTAQSAMLELTRQLEEACEMVELQNARLDQHHGAEIRMERERDEARAEVQQLRRMPVVEMMCENESVREYITQLEKRVERNATRVEIEQRDLYIGELRKERDEARAEVERLGRQVELLTDERDELLVCVASQNAELRATREAYIDAKWTNAYRRGAEAMREACAARLIAFGVDRLGRAITREHAAEIVGGTPIPEEP